MIELQNYIFNPEDKPKHQETIITCQGKIFNSQGSFSIISGLPKARKTTINLGIVFSMLTGTEIMGFKSKPMGKIIYVDTEQTKADMYRNYQYCKSITGVEPDLSKVNFFLFRTLEPEEILQRISEIIITYQPQVLFIDSLTDLVNNINDVIECKHVLNIIKNITTINNLSCISLIHNSKHGNHLSLGHLGSMADRNCQSNLSIKKCQHDKNASIIESKLMRSDADIESYKITFSGTDYDITDEITNQSKKPLMPGDINFSTHISFIENAFGYSDAYNYTGLATALKREYTKGDNWIKQKLIPYLLTNNFIKKVDKNYEPFNKPATASDYKNDTPAAPVQIAI
jgi:hypothetical protein